MRVSLPELEQRGASFEIDQPHETPGLFLAEDDWDGYLASCSRANAEDAIPGLGQTLAETKPLFSVRYTRGLESDGDRGRSKKLVELHQRHWVSSGEPRSYARSEMKNLHGATQVASVSGRDRLFSTHATLWSDPSPEWKRRCDSIALHRMKISVWYCFSTAVDYDSHSALSPGVLLNA